MEPSLAGLILCRMERRLITRAVAALLILAACGDDADVGGGGTGPPPESTGIAATEATAGTQSGGAGLAAECVAPPVTVVAQRVGSLPIGSEAFEVTDAVVLPLPIVPNPDGALEAQEVKALGTTTDLLGYSLVFGDEEIGGGQFLEYKPSGTGKLRGLVSIFPAAGVPFAQGDVVVNGEVAGLSIPLPTIGLDLAEFDQGTNMYLDAPTGQVTVLGITNDSVCLDLDLTWEMSDPADNSVTIRGVIAGRLLDRSTLFVLG